MNISGQMSDGVDGRFLSLGSLSRVSLESGLILDSADD